MRNNKAMRAIAASSVAPANPSTIVLTCSMLPSTATTKLVIATRPRIVSNVCTTMKEIGVSASMLDQNGARLLDLLGGRP